MNYRVFGSDGKIGLYGARFLCDYYCSHTRRGLRVDIVGPRTGVQTYGEVALIRLL